MLPGMMCDQALWQAQCDGLEAQAQCLPGDITGAETVAALAADVLSGAPEQFALAGLSMGGIVALEIWRQAPQRVMGLALLDTNHRADPPERRVLRERQIGQVRDGGLEVVLRDELKPNYMAQCHRGNVALLDEVLAMGMALGPAVFERQSLALRDRPDSTATLATIDVPVLVLCGEEDTLCPVALHREMAGHVRDAELVIVRDCGHLSTMEQPESVTQALRQWLARL